MENLQSNPPVESKDYAYNRIAENWHEWIDNYDTQRRVETLVEDFLGDPRIRGKQCLDAGCGLGFFTGALLKHEPNHLLAIDIAPKLIEQVKKQFPEVDAQTADLTNLETDLKGKENRFDIIVSSDVIEHTQCPQTAVKQITRYLKPGGLLSISVPNRRWKWLLYIAQFLHLRKNYQGHENWVKPKDLILWLDACNFEIIRKTGIHTVPWQFLPKKMLRRIDHILGKTNYAYALNLAILAQKSQTKNHTAVES